ncbi:MAG: UDP-N-acetylglucosamine 2-epimerase (non-hydrolyzing) [Desulfuromonadales bacterium]|nr:MAG: UDP-N-acetylglucosamine 2-epimerase (non-hydrolyzing) [Desulfuromonadales bacterium]
MKILSIVGARPNFMKIAPLCDQFRTRGISHVLVHTGQHYDHKMSKLFFEELGIPRPDRDLGVGSGTQAEQTAEIMRRLEPVLLEERPDLMIVVGDVTSTMAATITAAKLGISVAHVESGLRSFDRTMPEEINRLLTDSIADWHFTTEESANENLRREGVDSERIFFVGNTMIDSLLKHVDRADASPILVTLGVTAKHYGVVTLHRPSNVDSAENLAAILSALHEIAREMPLVFPVHPRTRKRITEFGLDHLVREGSGSGIGSDSGIVITEPLGYLDFLKLTREAKVVFTDSGGIQEETTVLGVPCVTLRENTERPVTVTCGTNILVGMDPEKILSEGRKRINGHSCEGSVPPLWDGKAAERIVDVIERLV